MRFLFIKNIHTVHIRIMVSNQTLENNTETQYVFRMPYTLAHIHLFVPILMWCVCMRARWDDDDDDDGDFLTQSSGFSPTIFVKYCVNIVFWMCRQHTFPWNDNAICRTNFAVCISRCLPPSVYELMCLLLFYFWMGWYQSQVLITKLTYYYIPNLNTNQWKSGNSVASNNYQCI